ncbi:MAG TPA: non-heme iron oxygenase ferredoxin subunit [Pyrinomonadaceae bacterium]
MPDFVTVASIDEVPPGRAKLVEVDGNEIALFNIAGTFHAVDNSCTHIGGPLCEGEINGVEVTCPWHGAVFDLHTGRALGPPAFEAVSRYEVRVEGAEIQIEV